MQTEIIIELAQNWQNLSPKNPELWAKWLTLNEAEKQELSRQIKEVAIGQNLNKMQDLTNEIEQDFTEIEIDLKEIRKKITQKV
ncbi:MAG: hypothetical protein MUE85_18880 [Microscillaceae bacterium]|jgi:archaellum component FlaC|nr:hypothetical protein [Microscillaceae bacterium]